MSALSLDDRKNPGGVLHYAPRRLGAIDDESTIRPVLERLSRGEGRTPAPRMIRKSGGVAAMPPVEFETAARNPLPIAARLAVAGGLMALVAALGAGLFIWPRSADHAAATTGAAPSTATNLPTPVHTVSTPPMVTGESIGSGSERGKQTSVGEFSRPVSRVRTQPDIQSLR